MAANTPTPPRWLPRLIDLGTGAVALGLLGIAGHATLLPADAAATYGVPAPPGGLPWVQAAGMRDAVLALLVLATLPHRAARPAVLGCALLLPLADVGLAFVHGGGWGATLPHATGASGIAILLGLALWERAGMADRATG